jgi:hypothetical protein
VSTETPPQDQPPGGGAPKTRLEAFIAAAPVVAALALLVLFVIVLMVLYFERDDANWDRLMFLLAGLEAVVFAGVGALFGTTVQRGVVQAARQDASAAKAEAATAREEAAESAADATAGRTLYRVVREKADASGAAVPPGGQGARPRAAGPAADTDLAELDRLARALFEK